MLLLDSLHFYPLDANSAKKMANICQAGDHLVRSRGRPANRLPIFIDKKAFAAAWGSSSRALPATGLLARFFGELGPAGVVAIDFGFDAVQLGVDLLELDMV